jgi:hypothetical protein
MAWHGEKFLVVFFLTTTTVESCTNLLSAMALLVSVGIQEAMITSG